MKYEVMNMGSESNPHNIDLGIGFSPLERVSFIKLFKEYKDIFSWAYDDLKTSDTKIIQNVILFKKDVNPFQQKLQKLHSSLETLVKIELNKLLAAKIIFPICHSQWVANLFLVWKKSGDSILCIYFVNLN